MDFEMVWTIARKDLSILREKKSVFYTVIFLPVMISVLLPGVIWYVGSKATTSPAILTGLLDSFSFLFIIIATVIPTAISSYSIVGEKVENSLEPLLARRRRTTRYFWERALPRSSPPSWPSSSVPRCS